MFTEMLRLFPAKEDIYSVQYLDMPCQGSCLICNGHIRARAIVVYRVQNINPK